MLDNPPRRFDALPLLETPKPKLIAGSGYLTRRERDMVQGLLDGKKNKEIAETYGVSENTVKVYLSRLFDKVGVYDRFTLCQWGRALAETERLTAQRYAELQRELNPGVEVPEYNPTFQNTRVTEFNVFKVMAQVIRLTKDQAFEIAVILSTKIHG